MGIEPIYTLLRQVGYAHPLHPTLTHLVIGLVMTAFFFGILGWSLRRNTLAQSARHCIALALFALIPTVLLGYMDWQYLFGGTMLLPIKMKLWLSAALFVFLVTAVGLGRRYPLLSIGTLVVYCCCFAAVIGIGYFGGELVYGTKKVGQSLSDEMTRQGAELFSKSCLICHFSDSTDNKVGPGLKDLYKRGTFSMNGQPVDDASLRQQLRTPYKAMPAFTSLTDSEIEALIAYLKTV